jgi:3-dehydroquinate synthase
MIERPIHLSFPHRVLFTRGVFASSNRALDQVLALAGEPGPHRFLVFLDGGVEANTPGLVEQIEAFFASRDGQHTLVASPRVLGGGETCKNEWERVPEIWSAINDAEIDRHSYVIAVGGGAFLDLVGFASATAHRGIRHIRVPTTTLSQGDGGVGVKNGVNFFGKKNWVGTFTVPFAIINDLDFLDSLPEREKRAGLVEAIKVSLIRDREFFERIERHADALAALDSASLEMAIRRSAELHVEHIATGGDPFELGSARPLDFGHWVAHKLEQISGFGVGHGEAVAIGMAVDLLYSARIGLLEHEVCERILDLLGKVGFELFSEHLIDKTADGQWAILRGLEEFREHLGGRLTITLVPEIGEKIEVHEMDEAVVLEAIRDLAARTAVPSKT